MTEYTYDQMRKVMTSLEELTEQLGENNVSVKVLSEKSGVMGCKIGGILSFYGIICTKYWPKYVIASKSDLEAIKCLS